MYLRCIDERCATKLELHQRALACPRCNGLLEVAAGPLMFSPQVLKDLWWNRRCSRDPRDRSGVWRFREFLPEYAPREIVTMGEGNVPLVAGIKSAGWAGLSDIRFKHLGWNPTACFKDLGMTVGVTEARFQGARTVACASTGNTAGSMAAYAARAGITARVYLPSGAVSPNKVAQALDYGAEIVEVEGSFDQALETVLHESGPEIYFLNSINPFRLEGQKTVMFELLEELGWNPPDYIVVPGGNLGNTSAFGKALYELKTAGLIDKVPRLVVVQAEGANPLVRTWRAGSDELQVVKEPRTAATAIRIGAPVSWKKALKALRFTNGLAIDVTDDEIAEAKSVIGRDGIGCEPASATTLAGARKLVRDGTISRDASVVAILTGHVLKDTDYITKSRYTSAVRTSAEVQAD
jgi:threonine synthase